MTTAWLGQPTATALALRDITRFVFGREEGHTDAAARASGRSRSFYYSYNRTRA